MGCGASTNEEPAKKNQTETKQKVEGSKGGSGIGNSGSKNLSSEGSVITIGLGTYGAEACMEYTKLIAQEHGVERGTKSQRGNGFEFIGRSFEEKKGCFTAKSILFDSRDSKIIKAKNEAYFEESSVILAGEDYKGRWSGSMNATCDIENLIEVIRKKTEVCDRVHAFQLFTDTTGAGLVSRNLCRQLSVNYGKKDKIINNIYDGSDSSYTAVYNYVSQTNTNLEHADLVNSYDISILSKRFSKQGFSSPAGMVGGIVADLTSGVRFNSSTAFGLTKILRSLNPYPRIHYCAVSYAKDTSVSGVFSGIISNDAYLSVGSHDSKRIASHYVFRGLANSEVFDFSAKRIKNGNFVDYNISGVNYSLTPCTGNDGKLSGVGLTNGAASVEFMKPILSSWESHYSERTGVSDFISDGAEEGEFSESMEEITALCRDYEEVMIEG